ncbi:MAG: hypothetical protein HKL90_15690 [Elusimicrobia bacterium]|nr:hypothetical protein [Elusimicrobiota bacterium]
MNFNEDGNLLGRVLALALLIGAVAEVRAVAYGGGCPFSRACGASSGAGRAGMVPPGSRGPLTRP